MSGSDSDVPDDVLDGLTGDSPTVNIEDAGGTEITIRKYLSRGDGSVEEVEEPVEGVDEESLRDEVAQDVEMRVEERMEEMEAEAEPESEPEPEPEPEPDPEPDDTADGTDDSGPVDGVDYNPSGGSGDDLTEITGVGDSVEERLNDIGVTTRADLAEQFESGGEAIGEVPAMWKDDIADQLGVELPESEQSGESEPDESGSDDGESDGPVDIEAIQDDLTTPIPDVGAVEEVVLLTTADCPGCMTAKDELSEHIDSGAITVLDIQESDRGADIAIEDGIQTTPSMVVIGEDGRAVF